MSEPRSQYRSRDSHLLGEIRNLPRGFRMAMQVRQRHSYPRSRAGRWNPVKLSMSR